MTKLKTKKKMNKSTIAIIIMAFIMVAMVAFGGTYAYFTATSESRASKFTVGKVALRSDATFTTVDKNVVPGDTVLNGSVSYINDSNVSTYIAVAFDVLYHGNYYVCTAASSGQEGATRTEATWEMRATKAPIRLTVEQTKDAFGNAFDIAEANTIINAAAWVQGGADLVNADESLRYDYRNIYLMGTTNNFKVAPEYEADGGTLKPKTTNFIKEGSTADILTSLNRKFQEVILHDTEGNALTTGIETITVMSIPSKKNETTEWAVNDVYLAWEEADITIQFTAYQIQTDWIGEDSEDEGTKGDNLANDAAFNTVWKAMQQKVGYTNAIKYFDDIKDPSSKDVDYTVYAAEYITEAADEVRYVIG